MGKIFSKSILVKYIRMIMFMTICECGLVVGLKNISTQSTESTFGRLLKTDVTSLSVHDVPMAKSM